MTINEYQHLAARTINQHLNAHQQEQHALFGLCGEVGEIHSLYQKQMQGHLLKHEDLKEEIGDVCWMIAELCTANGYSLERIMADNIEKLRKRYPEGFTEDRSVNRDEYK